MRNRLAIAVLVALIGLQSVPANAATKPSVVTAAFKSLLNATAASMDQLEQQYEADVDVLDAALAASTSSAEAIYSQELATANALYIPQIALANEKVDAAKIVFAANAGLKISQTLFSSMDKDRVFNLLICPETTLPAGPGWMEIAKRYCSNDNNKPRPGDISTKTTSKNTIGGEDWQPNEVAVISYASADNSYIQQAISNGWLTPVNVSLFDSSRNSIRIETANVADLIQKNGKARAAAQAKRDGAITQATTSRENALADLDETYEAAKAQLDARETAAQLALLASKRASKDSANFDSAFVVAYKFEYNRQMVNEIADAAWTGDWTYRTIDSIIKVNKLAITGDSIAAKYSRASAVAFNNAVGNAFTNEPEFRAALKVLTAIYKQTTKTTLKF
jgi:hypothetical protein